MKKTVVIVGAGLEQIRAYKVAKSLGYSTIATDIDKKAPAFEFSDYQLICSTRDPDATLEKLKGLTKKIKIGGVMTIGNDAAQTVALIASHFNLVGISQKAAFGASDKQKMKEIDDDIVPFGFIDDGSDEIARIENSNSGYNWAVEYDPNL